MRTAWEALVARARGMSTHLLADERAQALEQATSLAEVGHALTDTPYARHLGPAGGAPAALDVAITRSLAERMALLARWAGPEGGALRPIFLEQDALNVRDILRGHVGSLPLEQQTANAIPTPFLGRKELENLANADSIGAVAATLVEWGHPLGSPLLDEASQKHPDPFRLEVALARAAAREAIRAARTGNRRMRAFVRDEIDAQNVETALLLAGARSEGERGEFFIEGGSSVTREDFARAASAPSRAEAAGLLAAATTGTVLSAPLREGPATPAALSARILSARIDDLARRGRQEPLSPVPVIHFVLRLRREGRMVRRAVWGAALTGRRTQ